MGRVRYVVHLEGAYLSNSCDNFILVYELCKETLTKWINRNVKVCICPHLFSLPPPSPCYLNQQHIFANLYFPWVRKGRQGQLDVRGLCQPPTLNKPLTKSTRFIIPSTRYLLFAHGRG